MTDVDAEILIGEHIVALANNKATKRPIAVTDRKLTTTWIFELGQLANLDLSISH